MNILGVGGEEFILVFVLMLVIAGPKRMIQWAYVLGKWVAKFRVMWSQTIDMIQKEFDSAGVDVKLPKTPPTRANVSRSIQNVMRSNANNPTLKALNEVKSDIEQVDKEVNSALKVEDTPKPKPKPAPQPAVTNANANSMGTWGGAPSSANGAGSTANGKTSEHNDFGSWSHPGNSGQDE